MGSGQLPYQLDSLIYQTSSQHLRKGLHKHLQFDVYYEAVRIQVAWF